MASEKKEAPVRFCYRCGAKLAGETQCPACGEPLNLSQDVYFTHEVCYTCEQPVPRWSNFCPYCGEAQAKNDDAGYPKQWRRYKRNLVLTDCVWTLAILLAALLLPGKLPILSPWMALVAAAVALLFVWGAAVVAMIKGGYWEGTVIGLTTEPGTQKVCVDAGTFEEVPCTVYKTEIRWDNGKTLVRSEKDNRADHEQLKIGDRVRLYKGISRFAKL